MKNTSPKKKITPGQADLYRQAYQDQPEERTKKKTNGKGESCEYIFTDLTVPTLKCQHDHRVILVDPVRNMKTLAMLVRRGELTLGESERYTQLSVPV